MTGNGEKFIFLLLDAFLSGDILKNDNRPGNVTTLYTQRSAGAKCNNFIAVWSDHHCFLAADGLSTERADYCEMPGKDLMIIYPGGYILLVCRLSVVRRASGRQFCLGDGQSVVDECQDLGMPVKWNTGQACYRDA